MDQPQVQKLELMKVMMDLVFVAILCSLNWLEGERNYYYILFYFILIVFDILLMIKWSKKSHTYVYFVCGLCILILSTAFIFLKDFYLLYSGKIMGGSNLGSSGNTKCGGYFWWIYFVSYPFLLTPLVELFVSWETGEEVGFKSDNQVQTLPPTQVIGSTNRKFYESVFESVPGTILQLYVIMDKSNNTIDDLEVFSLTISFISFVYTVYSLRVCITDMHEIKGLETGRNTSVKKCIANFLTFLYSSTEVVNVIVGYSLLAYVFGAYMFCFLSADITITGTVYIYFHPNMDASKSSHLGVLCLSIGESCVSMAGVFQLFMHFVDEQATLWAIAVQLFIRIGSITMSTYFYWDSLNEKNEFYNIFLWILVGSYCVHVPLLVFYFWIIGRGKCSYR